MGLPGSKPSRFEKGESQGERGQTVLAQPSDTSLLSSTQKTSTRPRGGARSEPGERRCTPRGTRTWKTESGPGATATQTTAGEAEEGPKARLPRNTRKKEV